MFDYDEVRNPQTELCEWCGEFNLEEDDDDLTCKECSEWIDDMSDIFCGQQES